MLQQVGQPERVAYRDGGEVADGHADGVGTRLGSELGDHGRRQLDSVNVKAVLGEW